MIRRFANIVRSRQAAAAAMVLCVLPGVVQGCSSPTAPSSPPSGGQTITLDFTQFQATVEPVLSRRTCDSGGDCHGGGIRGTLQLSPESAKDPHFDFDQVSMQVSASNRDQSPVLTRPLDLSAGGTVHPYKAFATTGDSDYVAIRAWIMAGTVQ